MSGQAYQDPKDALNEFVSNAADEYVEAGKRGERIRVVLRRKGRYPVIAVDDSGQGMSRDRLREVARNLFESSKAGDDRTLGEKAIGILAFQQLCGRCDVVSRAESSSETWVLHLERGNATATLELERRRARQEPGTTVYLSDLDPEVLRVLTQRRVVEYLRSRRGVALANGDYELEVVEGRSSEFVLPEKPEGIKLSIPARHTLWGRIEFVLYVAQSGARRRRVSVVGRAGTSILDDLAELEGIRWYTLGQRPGLGSDRFRVSAANRRTSGDPPRSRGVPTIRGGGQGDRTGRRPNDRASRSRGRRRDGGPTLGRDPADLRSRTQGVGRPRQPDAVSRGERPWARGRIRSRSPRDQGRERLKRE